MRADLGPKIATADMEIDRLTHEIWKATNRYADASFTNLNPAADCRSVCSCREFEKQHADTMAQRGLGYKAWIPSPSGRPQFGDPVEAPVPADLSPPPLTAQLQGLIDQRNSEAAKADQLREQLAAAKDPSPERPVRARSASLSVCAISLT